MSPNQRPSPSWRRHDDRCQKIESRHRLAGSNLERDLREMEIWDEVAPVVSPAGVAVSSFKRGFPPAVSVSATSSPPISPEYASSPPTTGLQGGCSSTGRKASEWSTSNLFSIVEQHDAIITEFSNGCDSGLASHKLRALWHKYKALFLSPRSTNPVLFPSPFTRPVSGIQTLNPPLFGEFANIFTSTGEELDPIVESVFAASGVCSFLDEERKFGSDSAESRVAALTTVGITRESGCASSTPKNDLCSSSPITRGPSIADEYQRASSIMNTPSVENPLWIGHQVSNRSRQALVDECVRPSSPPNDLFKSGSTNASLRVGAEKYSEGVKWMSTPIHLQSHQQQLLPLCCRYYQLIAATFQFNMGQLEDSQGHWSQALDLYNQGSKRLQDACLLSSNTLDKTVDENMAKLRISLLFATGFAQFSQGFYAEALDTYETILALSKNVYDLSNTTIAAAHNCVGVTHYYLGSMGENESTHSAEEHLVEALRRFRLGMHFEEIGTTLNNLGRVFFQRDEYDRSLDTYEEALELRKEVLGCSHLDVGATYFNMGQAENQRGNANEALVLYENFQKILIEKFGEIHPDLVTVNTYMGQIYQDQQKFDSALKLYIGAKQIAEECYGRMHSEVALLWNKIGNCCYDEGEWKDALRCYEKGLQVEKSVRDPARGADVLVTLQNLADTHVAMAVEAEGKHDIAEARAQYSSALERYTEKKQIQEALHGFTHNEVAKTLLSMASVHLGLDSIENALECAQLARTVQLEVFGSDGRALAPTLSKLGFIMYRASLHEAALSVLAESIRIYELNDDICKDMVLNKFYLASIYLERGEHDRSMRSLISALRLEEQLSECPSFDTGMIRFKMAQVLEATGELDLAVEEFKEGLRLERLVVGNDHIYVAQTLNEMGNLYLRMNDIPNMMEAFAEASRIYQMHNRSPDTISIFGESLYAFEAAFPAAAPAA